MPEPGRREGHPVGCAAGDGGGAAGGAGASLARPPARTAPCDPGSARPAWSAGAGPRPRGEGPERGGAGARTPTSAGTGNARRALGPTGSVWRRPRKALDLRRSLP